MITMFLVSSGILHLVNGTHLTPNAIACVTGSFVTRDWVLLNPLNLVRVTSKEPSPDLPMQSTGRISAM